MRWLRVDVDVDVGCFIPFALSSLASKTELQSEERKENFHINFLLNRMNPCVNFILISILFNFFCERLAATESHEKENERVSDLCFYIITLFMPRSFHVIVFAFRFVNFCVPGSFWKICTKNFHRFRDKSKRQKCKLTWKENSCRRRGSPELVADKQIIKNRNFSIIKQDESKNCF